MEDQKCIISEDLLVQLNKDKNREYIVEELVPEEESNEYFAGPDDSKKPPRTWVYAYMDNASRYKRIALDPNATLEEIQISLLSKQTKNIRIIKNILVALVIIAVVAGILGAVGVASVMKDLAALF